MNSVNLTEAEIQLLIALIEIEDPVETPNNNFYRFYPENMEQAATYFRKYREDWTKAYSSLSSLELIHKIEKEFLLTPKGKDVAVYLRNNRPPIWYWYKEFYSDASQSQAYRLFCEELYGKYLCQQSFSDMKQVDAMIQIANLSSKNKVLELGCGTGMLAEYIADQTKAFVHGIDYSPDAIEIACNSIKSKSGFLAFSTGNMDSLDIEPQTFDTVISVDSLYMPQNLYKTITDMGDILIPGGQIFVFYSIFNSPDDSKELLMPDNTVLADALRKSGFVYSIIDFSSDAYKLMQKKRQLAEKYRDIFQKENRSYLFNHLIEESADPLKQYDPESVMQRRYLYHAKREI